VGWLFSPASFIEKSTCPNTMNLDPGLSFAPKGTGYKFGLSLLCTPELDFLMSCWICVEATIVSRAIRMCALDPGAAIGLREIQVVCGDRVARARCRDVTKRGGHHNPVCLRKARAFLIAPVFRTTLYQVGRTARPSRAVADGTPETLMHSP
jgi:hypothetical protein